jgi:aldose 1-epimerase
MTSRSDVSGAVSRLEAGTASALIDAEHGGLLASLSVDGLELLAPAAPRPGMVPRGGSFVLAPWVGELFEGRLPFRGREHRLPTGTGRHAVHGLVYSGAWAVEHVGAARVILARELVEPWPFGGTVRQTFELGPDGLTQSVEIVAVDLAMPVSLGWHPWFRVPDPASVSVALDAGRFLDLDGDLIPTGEVRDVSGVVDLRHGPVLGARRIDVVYVDARSPARLTLPGRIIEISFDPLISIVVVYVADGTVCIEPWTSWPDAPNASDRGCDTGLVVLEAGDTLRRWMRWSW